MAIHVHFNTLSKVQLFQECDKSLLFDLVTKLKPTLYLPGDYVCRKVSFNEVIIHREFEINEKEQSQGLLPPASEGWGRYCFHRCLSVHIGGYPSIRFFPLSLVPGPFWWGTPVPARGNLAPYPGWDWGTPPPPSWDWDTSPLGRQNSRASTCYAAGGMALAVTQKDFLVQ